MDTQNTADKSEKTTSRRRLSGVVVSNKMKDTIVVSVSRYVKQPKYKKFVRRVKKYMAHDTSGAREIGEKVVIEETRPLSKNKHFQVVGEKTGEAVAKSQEQEANT